MILEWNKSLIRTPGRSGRVYHKIDSYVPHTSTSRKTVFRQKSFKREYIRPFYQLFIKYWNIKWYFIVKRNEIITINVKKHLWNDQTIDTTAQINSILTWIIIIFLLKYESKYVDIVYCFFVFLGYSRQFVSAACDKQLEVRILFINPKWEVIKSCC